MLRMEIKAAFCEIGPDTFPRQANMKVMDAENLRRVGETVLSAQAEAARASMPTLCTTWCEDILALM